MFSKIEPADPSGWSIDRHGKDGPFLLTHPKFETIGEIPSFDEACRLRDCIRTGRFIPFIRGYELFLEGIKKHFRS